MAVLPDNLFSAYLLELQCSLNVNEYLFPGSGGSVYRGGSRTGNSRSSVDSLGKPRKPYGFAGESQPP